MYTINITYYNRYRFVCENKFYYYRPKSGLRIGTSINDYRNITDEEKLYVKNKKFNLIKIEDTYIPIKDLEDAIKIYKEYIENRILKNLKTLDEYESFKDNINQKMSEYLDEFCEISLYKDISLSDIQSFYRITSYLQIDGMKFPFVKAVTHVPGHKYWDKFYIEKYQINDEQTHFLEKHGFRLVNDTPEGEMERHDYYVFPINFSDIEGFVIEKEYCDINDFGKSSPMLTGKKEVYYLDRVNPDPAVWKMLQENRLIREYDF